MRYSGNRVTLSHRKMQFLVRVILVLPFVLRKDNIINTIEKTSARG